MIRTLAPAKLNLYLHITGKRADGYHLLESLAAFTAFGDTLEFTEAADVSLAIDGPFASLLEVDHNDNLVLRAARALRQHAGIRRGAAIRLTKQIPMRAGLGGGSSDAAATLKGLMQLWQLSLDDKELLPITLALGSDVPVCMATRPALIEGIGGKVTPVDMQAEGGLLLANPGVPLLTADVYRRRSGPFTPPSTPLGAIHGWEQLVALMQAHRNDLEPPALALMPVIADVLAALRATKACAMARMSGSGATCFALYRNRYEAENAKAAIQQAHPGWWFQVTAFKESEHGKTQ